MTLKYLFSILLIFSTLSIFAQANWNNTTFVHRDGRSIKDGFNNTIQLEGVNIRNVMGQLISSEFFTSINTIPIYLDGNNGLYFIELISADSKSIIKVVKE